MFLANNFAILTALLWFPKDVIPQQPTPLPFCVDTASNCPQVASHCYRRPFSQIVQIRCIRTCFTCDCIDTASDCATYSALCDNPAYENVLRARCQVTCGFCAGCGYRRNQIVPDVTVNPPSRRVRAFFNNLEVTCGNPLTPAQVSSPPTRLGWDADSNGLYTLILTDPDAPSRQNPTLREWLHWLVINIPGNNTSRGNVIATFIPSGPPQGTGLHRYVFLVFSQPGNITNPGIGPLPNATGRPNFNTNAFVTRNNLGFAYAGNFYQSQFQV
ncbi:26 kDa secreted antigen [Toxocara canis]|uniref:26 kDa secreted antigen n=1 Tax=Toxocara canis TaxID=6265 RepID=A0A0B2V8K8_TOXCA|nr:26 kDa secreted antigen [Toxocara canis]